MATIPFNPCDLSHLSFMTTPMKDLSLFLLKNSFASRMKRGIRSFCHDVSSTSTLNQSDISNNHNQNTNVINKYADDINNNNNNDGSSPKTLEEMLLQLDLEEAAARRAKLEEYGELNRRMSCVNNSDILRSARNALNQYPRFSLDGRDAMYRSSFRRNLEYELDVERSLRMPPTVAGECVVWCKPGVVAKLMGLDAVPVPVKGRKRSLAAKRDRNLVSGMNNVRRSRRRSVGSSSAVEEKENEYCVMKPVKGCGERWEIRRAR